MTRMSLAALGAAIALSACTPPEIASRMDSNDTLNSGFASAESYTPRVVGSRSQNDFMRFSTQGLPQ